MTRTLMGIVGVALALGYSPVALAGFDTGNDFLSKCSDEGSFRQGFCAGYVAAVADAIPAIDSRFGNACIPATVSLKQLMDVSVQYVEDRPAIRHNAAASLIFEAIKDAFPC